MRPPIEMIKVALRWQGQMRDLVESAALARDEGLLICLYGIGDTIFTCGFGQQFLDRYGLKMVLAVSPGHTEIATMFAGKSRAIPFVKGEFTGLNRWRLKTRTRAYIVHPAFYRFGNIRNRIGLEGFTLLDCYREILSLPASARVAPPSLPAEWRVAAKAQFSELKLPAGRTVLLAPSAHSIGMMSPCFWSKLSEQLISQGWHVCYNMNVSNATCPTGATPVGIPMKHVIPFAEECGWVISLRSGLCDLLAFSKSRLTVIYPDRPFRAGTVLSATSLVKMGLCTHAEEIVSDANGEIVLKMLANARPGE